MDSEFRYPRWQRLLEAAILEFDPVQLYVRLLLPQVSEVLVHVEPRTSLDMPFLRPHAKRTRNLNVEREAERTSARTLPLPAAQPATTPQVRCASTACSAECEVFREAASSPQPRECTKL